MDDLISRQGVLRLLNAVPSEEFATKAMLISGVNALPSAQPSATDTNVGGNLIDRQAAIETVRKAKDKSEAHRMLVQLPSAQPECEDAVSREAIMKLYGSEALAHISRVSRKDLLDFVEQLPSVTPKQPGWIPCTPETMPKMTDTYLVQVGINENGEGMHTEVRTAGWNVVWQEWYVHTTRCFVGDIIKWMPIPWEGGQ